MRNALTRGTAFGLSCLALHAVMSGCGGAAEVGDDPAGEECTDPAYGDGSCDLSLDCAAPDIDCFRTFESQEEAEDWFVAFEAEVAPTEGREPFAVVPSSDARFARMRELLDRGWDAYARAWPVGELAELSPALVLIDNDQVNAFVVPESAERARQAFAVMVFTGTLDADLSDAQLVGLVAHELTHAMGLHGVGDLKIQLQRHYMAGADEGFGFEQTHDPEVQAAIADWVSMAADVGPHTDSPLGGFALKSGTLREVVLAALDRGADGSDPACRASLEAYDAFEASLAARYSEVDVGYDFGGIETATGQDAVEAVNGLIQDCLAGYTVGLIDLFAEMKGLTAAQVRERLDDADEAIVDGKHVLVALWDFHLAIRSRMRDVEADLAEATGASWTAARYYSHEEMADDYTIPVFEAADLPVTGGEDFLMTLFSDDEARDECRTRLAAGVPLYGDDLADEHHATCWRVSHLRQLAADPDRLPVAALSSPPRAPVAAPVRRYQPLFPARPPIRIH